MFKNAFTCTCSLRVSRHLTTSEHSRSSSVLVLRLVAIVVGEETAVLVLVARANSAGDPATITIVSREGIAYLRRRADRSGAGLKCKRGSTDLGRRRARAQQGGRQDRAVRPR